ncbi:MAG: lamin tail domain-containing protein [Verrucomicrobiales bacterium]
MALPRAIAFGFVVACLLARAQALEISEILTENEGGLRDADGNTPGWVEIHNESAAAADLTGWHLTDNATFPSKWAFPSMSLPGGAYLVVFASGKDRAVAGQELHTNFQLDPDGEYLALVAPNGSRPSEYAPYPELRRNISYAVARSGYVLPLANAGSTAYYRVPADGSLGDTWTQAGFDHSSWPSGPTGLGYDLGGSAAGPLLSIDITDRDSNTPALLEPGFQAFVIGNVGGNAAIQTGPITRTFGAYSVTLANSGTDGYDDRLRTTPANSGAFTESLLLRDFVFSRDQTGTSGLDVTVAGLPANSVVRVSIWSFDTSSAGSRVADWSCNGIVIRENYTFNGSTLPSTNDQYRFDFTSTTNASGQLLIQGRRDPSSATFGVFLNALRVESLSLQPMIGTDVGPVMHNVNASLYARLPFSVPAPEEITTLRMRLNYDDGVAAWVNGNRLVLRNAPDPPVWDSASLAARPQGDVFTEETLDLPVQGLLVAGTNVLSLQGLNASVADSDFLLLPQLKAIGETAAAPFYFAAPTPGAANGQGSTGLVRDTRFSVDRGFFDAPVSVELTCNTTDTQIRYTTDGSAPTATTGQVYSAPVAIASTTVLRAAAFKSGWIPSNVDAQTYVFPAQVAQQPANPAGWPLTWGIDSEVNTNDGAGDGTVPANYEMDPAVVNNTLPGYGVAEVLDDLPTMSLAMSPADFLGPAGIYQNPRSSGPGWERPCSIEFFDPSGAEDDFHETCAVEIHGNSSRRPWRMQKHSFRLSFRGELGSAKLRYRLFPGLGVREFNELVLRACFTDSWGLVSWDPNRYRPDDSVYYRDMWMRAAHANMGYLAATGRFVHLYVNDLYWGVFNLSERVEEDFFADHLGGRPQDWEVVSDFVDPDPSPTSHWKTFFNLVNAGLTTQTAYQQVQQYADLASFADYYFLHVLADAEDWPHHNGHAARNRTITNDPYRWLVWDQEIMLDNHSINRVGVGATNTGTDRTPGRLYQKLRENPEFRLLFADRAHKQMHNDGALNLTNNQSLWQSFANQLDKPIVAESARWGDTADETPYGNVASKPLYTREADWLPTVDSVKNAYLPSLYDNANSFATIRKLQAAGMYPATVPPSFSQHGGSMPSGFQLSITAPAGQIYYSLDGTDPRQAFTGTAVGTLYQGPVSLTQTGVVKARAQNGAEWSALTEATFIVGVPASAANLVISEIHYHPMALGELEFIELVNIANTSVDLTAVHFTVGISYEFPAGTVLAPGQRIVVTGVQFTGRLDNDGEYLVLLAADGSEIANFRFNDAPPWPSAADDAGHSLVLIAPGTHPNPALPESWRPSVSVGGSAGSDDAMLFSGDMLADADADGQSAFLEYALGSNDLDPGAMGQIEVAFETIDLGGPEPEEFLTLTFLRAAAADSARLLPDVSGDLGTWTPAVLVRRELATAGKLAETWRTPLSTVAERQFLRLRVTPQ